MTRLYIICEGVTEQDFCHRLLQPYLLTKDVLLYAPLVSHSRGGMVHWLTLRRQIERYLASDKTAHVSTFIDFYGILPKHDLPGWQAHRKLSDKVSAVDGIEGEMRLSIRPELQSRFLPYLQLHEFEALLFCSLDVFEQQFERDEIRDWQLLEDILTEYPNPELINDHKSTAPSARLTELVSGYKKAVYGSILAEAIGLIKIRHRCKRFDAWVARLASLT